MNKKFNPSKIQCLTCMEIIQSSYPGEWVCCSCYTSSHKELNKTLEEQKIVSHSTSRFKLMTREQQDQFYALCDSIITGCFIDSTEYYERVAGYDFRYVNDDT